MAIHSQTPEAAPNQRLRLAVLLCLIGLCCVVEITLQMADVGALASARLRSWAYENGGFWVGLLRSWTPNYPGQPYLMFITYGFLHSGLLHLVVNMITLWSLAQAVMERVRIRGFLLLYLASLLGGGVGYTLLAPTLAPMVGASGALFGLAGGLLAWGYVDRMVFEEALWPIARAAGLLLALNLIMWWAMHGQLAWQAHLGGFISGWVTAMLIDPRARVAD